MNDRTKILLAAFGAGLLVLGLVAYLIGGGNPENRTRTKHVIELSSNAPPEVKRVVQ